MAKLSDMKVNLPKIEDDKRQERILELLGYVQLVHETLGGPAISFNEDLSSILIEGLTDKQKESLKKAFNNL